MSIGLPSSRRTSPRAADFTEFGAAPPCSLHLPMPGCSVPQPAGLRHLEVMPRRLAPQNWVGSGPGGCGRGGSLRPPFEAARAVTFLVPGGTRLAFREAVAAASEPVVPNPRLCVFDVLAGRVTRGKGSPPLRDPGDEHRSRILGITHYVTALGRGYSCLCRGVPQPTPVTAVGVCHLTYAQLDGHQVYRGWKGEAVMGWTRHSREL
jgi:hypothetical protein